MRFRQVHLDFHTSEKISDIGTKFDKEQFQEALKVGHVDSITVFSVVVSVSVSSEPLPAIPATAKTSTAIITPKSFLFFKSFSI